MSTRGALRFAVLALLLLFNGGRSEASDVLRATSCSCTISFYLTSSSCSGASLSQSSSSYEISSCQSLASSVYWGVTSCNSTFTYNIYSDSSCTTAISQDVSTTACQSITSSTSMGLDCSSDGIATAPWALWPALCLMASLLWLL
eukprot:CAMPEP_0174371070 /NCGR_PEP_ID=MMETSP0811_2-20130205/98408_1 /TAXON_ID=73025 ORGANISM="Eutreptiella gymnastica-like, Strain CCMP1594" /NCGR_SAMPLE_ID=MMETSP0811_2 /ASSEMBLY_ACC=CAM_ASM_000667 /LENGTH=144 /DNA_ID=CAMNT_0015517095 /DNA_START=29 /DNA_END=463 /DNA_ORIENTATION=-